MKDFTHENELMAEPILPVNSLHKVDIEYHGKSVNTLGQIKHISLMNRIDIFT